MTAKSLSLEGTLAPSDLAVLLEELATGLRAGVVCLHKGEEFLTLKPGSALEFEVEAAVKKGRQRLDLSVKWREPGEAAPLPDFRISAVEPAPGVADQSGLASKVQEDGGETAPAEQSADEAAGTAREEDAPERCGDGEEEKDAGRGKAKDKEKREKKSRKH
jgi:amphi-Trp domain-containing protein